MIPDKGVEVTAEKGVVNTFRILFTDWAAPITADSSVANSFHGGETFDTSSLGKNLDLGRKIKMPKFLPK